MTYLAVPIAAANLDQASCQIKTAAKAGAEMLELRTDYLEELNVDTVKAVIEKAKATKLPLIVTCRDKAQGGSREWSVELRTDVLVEAVKAGADYVDCEYSNYTGQTREQLKAVLEVKSDTRLILSVHNFAGAWSSEQLSKLYDDIVRVESGAIPKLIYTAGHINDCFAAFDLLENNKDKDLIVLCMGPCGFISRVLAKKLASFVTFACLGENNATAPGQISVEDLKDLYRWDDIGDKTEIFGVIGYPVGHSMSPAIFNACFTKAKIDAVYLPFLVDGEKEEFNEFMDNLLSRSYLDFGGFSVTIPHKAHALEYVTHAGEHIEALAANIGAANTLKIGFGGIISGYNTDYAGAIDALADAIEGGRHELHNVDVAVIGAGGAARAVVAGLVDVGAKVTIYNRTISKARSLAEEFNCKYMPLDAAGQMDAKIVINCTSIGMYPNIDDCPIPAGGLSKDMIVFDTVYNPLETLLLKRSTKIGAKVVTGAEMFVRQAMSQYKIFTGQDADEKVMRKTVLEKLKQ